MINSFESPRSSDSLDLLFTALSKAQGAITNPPKDNVVKVDTKGGGYKYSYADLQTVWDAIRKPLADTGLSVSQWLDTFPVGPGEYVDVIVTILAHESGQWRGSVMRLEAEQGARMTSIQALGSAITYLRRYALMAVLGVAPEDDDGAAAKDTPPEAPRTAPAPRTPRRVPNTLPATKTAPIAQAAQAVDGAGNELPRPIPPGNGEQPSMLGAEQPELATDAQWKQLQRLYPHNDGKRAKSRQELMAILYQAAPGEFTPPHNSLTEDQALDFIAAAQG